MPVFISREEYDPAAATDSELESANLLSYPDARTPKAAGWGRAGAKAVLLFGMGCAVGFVAYSATSSKAPSPGEEALGFDMSGIVQKSSGINHTCPEGYFVTHLDMSNHDADMHDESVNASECAVKCDEDEKCKGFEYNEGADHCWITRTGHHCTDKQHDGWVSCLRSNATCPAGYAVTDMDMMNHDAEMHEESLDADACAEKCTGDAECKGFEYSVGAKHCWVSRSGHHCLSKQHDGWVSCIRVE